MSSRGIGAWRPRLEAKVADSQPYTHRVDTGDAFGEMLRSYARDGEGVEIVERDDGFITASVLGPAHYLAPFRRWLSLERQAIRLARGRVLDIGAGGFLHRHKRALAYAPQGPASGQPADE